MRLGITSLQRGRAAYLLEWIAFHQVVGFERFIIYSHGPDPEQEALLDCLTRVEPSISWHRMGHEWKVPQLKANRHSWRVHGKEVDAMAFIDGDEFLYSPHGELRDTVTQLLIPEASALGVYWLIYGSSGHLDEPDGLLLEQFTRHAESTFGANRHIKIVLRSGEDAEFVNSHFFFTPKGTVDELGRRIQQPVSPFAPSHKYLCINHYVTQSRAYYEQVKRHMGQADRAPKERHERAEDWFHAHDRNECAYGYALNFALRTKLRMDELLTQVRRVSPEYRVPSRRRYAVP
jgi:hypothetical protein